MSTAVAKRPLRQVQSVKELLVNDVAKGQLAAVAAKHMKPERLMRVTANAIRSTPKLQQCDPLSFLGALMQCAALGLEPNTVLGHAYLIPFENKRKNITEVQVVIGYKGLIDLARRSGHITSISANIHYSDDELWEYEEGTEARLRHRPGPQEGQKLHAYAIAKFTDGGHAYVVLPWSHVMKIRDGSQGYSTAIRFNRTDNPWMTHEDAMAKKTAIRALSKYLPLSVEFIDAVQVDGDAGASVDYAAYAMNPADGPTIEGEFVEHEDEEASDEGEAAVESTAREVDGGAEAKREAKSKPSTEAGKQKAEQGKGQEAKKEAAKKEAEPEEERKGFGAEQSDDEAYDRLCELIEGELQEAEDAGGVEAVLELYGDQIAQLSGTDYFDRIQEAADARREELA